MKTAKALEKGFVPENRLLILTPVVSLVLLSASILIAIGLNYFTTSASRTTSFKQASTTTRHFAKRMDTQPRPIAGTKRVMIFGGSGMIGQGVIRECLEDPQVEQVVTVGRKATGTVHEKIREIEHPDMSNYDAISEDMKNVDAVFWALGVSSTDVNKEQYERITKDFTLAAIKTLHEHNPNMTFVYVSGEGTDASSSTHWQRIKGETENAVMDLPWHGYAFRPGMIRSMNQEQSKTKLYRVIYNTVGRVLVPLAHKLFPNSISTTEEIGQGFLELSRHGSDKKVLYNADMTALAKAAAARSQASL
jgi:hypothetical protein